MSYVQHNKTYELTLIFHFVRLPSTTPHRMKQNWLFKLIKLFNLIFIVEI